MKLYDNTERIYNELAATGMYSGDLTVSSLSKYDQYHYYGTDAVDHCIQALSITSDSNVIDIGSGIGGPARYIAWKTGARVTALELQSDLNDVANDLTARTNLSTLVEHIQRDVLDGNFGSEYDYAISFLAILHIPDRKALWKQIWDCLKPGGSVYVEDFIRCRDLDPKETEDLRNELQCRYLPRMHEYKQQILMQGFHIRAEEEMTEPWTAFTKERQEDFNKNITRHTSVHGERTVEALQTFYDVVADLFQKRAVGGVRLILTRV